MSKENTARSVHQRLLNVRDKTNVQFNHLLMRYTLERLLYRLVATGHGEQFVLKGAMLFALWHDVPGRPTRDIDLLGFGNINHEYLRSVFTKICNVDVVEDGLRFDADSITTKDIRNDQEYHGIRIRLSAFLNRARIAVQIDIGFGDVLIPKPATIDYPTILNFPSPRLKVYHPATVIAEKLSAIIILGMLNSRIKDFFDIHVILRYMDIDDTKLLVAIKSTFQRRKVELPHEMPVAFTMEFLEDGKKEIQWQAFLKRNLLSEYGFTLARIITDLRKKLWPVFLQLQDHKKSPETNNPETK